jgi:2-succinyl-6-hydroxy-2,4-cyclohexadiene-1-carboxylate synthase
MQQLLWFGTIGENKVPPIVLLHGFTGTHSTWDRLCSELARDHFLVLPDLPGHGNSSTISYMNVDQIADEILAVLDALHIEKTSMLGYSMGGRVALHFATMYQDRLSCLMLESTSPGIRDSKEREERILKDTSLAKDIREHGLTWFLDRWENLDLFATQKSLSPEARQKIRNERLGNTAEGLAGSLENAGAGAMPAMWAEIHSLEIPILLIAGERDEKYVSIAEEMKKGIGGTNCVIKIVKNAGHAAHLEDPQMFQNTVQEFLRSARIK